MGITSSKQLADWTSKDLEAAIGTLGVKYFPYQAVIKENGVAGDLLASLSNKDELDEIFADLGITNRLHKRVLSLRWETLHHSGTTTSTCSLTEDQKNTEGLDLKRANPQPSEPSAVKRVCAENLRGVENKEPTSEDSSNEAESTKASPPRIDSNVSKKIENNSDNVKARSQEKLLEEQKEQILQQSNDSKNTKLGTCKSEAKTKVKIEKECDNNAENTKVVGSPKKLQEGEQKSKESENDSEKTKNNTPENLQKGEQKEEAAKENLNPAANTKMNLPAIGDRMTKGIVNFPTNAKFNSYLKEGEHKEQIPQESGIPVEMLNRYPNGWVRWLANNHHPQRPQPTLLPMPHYMPPFLHVPPPMPPMLSMPKPMPGLMKPDAIPPYVREMSQVQLMNNQGKYGGGESKTSEESSKNEKKKKALNSPDKWVHKGKKPHSIEKIMQNQERSQAWYDRFQELAMFKEIHGNCMVPQKYEPNRSLGIWVNKQRMEYKLLNDGKKSSMNPERIAALKSIGFEWSKRKGRVAWEAKFKKLCEYKQLHGNCVVPTKYVEDSALGRWVSTQREQYRLWKAGNKMSKMTVEKIRRLEEVGFIWKLQN